MNFIEELGVLAIGSRIKNLSELMMRDVSKIYREYNVDFEPRWFTFFHLILSRKEVSVTEIATELNQTHPAVVQVINVLEKKKLIVSGKDKADQRKRLIRLSKKGKKLAEDLQPLWEVVRKVSEEILNESDPGFLDRISELEKALRKKSTYERVNEGLEEAFLKEMQIIGFDKDYLADFQSLNEDWLNTYLEVSAHDKHMLANPIKEIIRQNGEIFFMLYRGEAIGTYVLQNLGEGYCELSKVTIKKKYRGRKLGQRLMGHAVEEAIKLGCKGILLHTHHNLEEATQLYKKAGFNEIEGHSLMKDLSGRCSMTMQLIINQ